MSDNPNQLEIIETLSVPRYAPRLRPTAIPAARWDDEPLLCLKVNDDWVSHILGVLTALDQPDTWIGTREQINDARQQVNAIMLAFMEDCNPMDNCCPEPNRRRYTSDGSFEVSYDGGMTWTSGDDFDPRITSPTYPPLGGSNGNPKKCDAANSVVVQIEDKVETWKGYKSTLGSVLEFGLAAIAALAVGVFDPAAVPFVFSACLAILKALWEHESEEYDLAFTDTVYNQLLCILYCHVQPDGTFTASDVTAIINDCVGTFDSIVSDAFKLAFTGWGAVGTTNAAAIGGGGLDCDDCECEDCNATWIVGNLDGAPAFGTFVDVDTDGYYIFESHLHTDGANYLSIKTTDETKFCTVLAILGDPTMPSTGIAAARIIAPATQHIGNITVGPVDAGTGQVSYIAWNSSNAFRIKILFG